MMAALQVQEALKLLHGMPVAAGSALVFNGVAQPVLFDAAAAPGRLPEPRDLSGAGRAGAGTTSRPLPSFLRRLGRVVEGRLHLVLDRELVVAIECPRCEWRRRGHAAASEGPSRPRPSARTAVSRRGRCSPARSRNRFAPGRRAALPRRHPALRYREGRRPGRFGVLPPGRRPRRGGNGRGWGIRAVERRRHRLSAR